MKHGIIKLLSVAAILNFGLISAVQAEPFNCDSLTVKNTDWVGNVKTNFQASNAELELDSFGGSFTIGGGDISIGYGFDTSCSQDGNKITITGDIPRNDFLYGHIKITYDKTTPDKVHVNATLISPANKFFHEPEHDYHATGELTKK